MSVVLLTRDRWDGVSFYESKRRQKELVMFLPFRESVARDGGDRKEIVLAVFAPLALDDFLRRFSRACAQKGRPGKWHPLTVLTLYPSSLELT